jgi:hypothetical protein
VVEKRIEHNLIARRALHKQRARTVFGEQYSNAVLPPQLLTVNGFVIVAIVGINRAKTPPRQFL